MKRIFAILALLLAVSGAKAQLKVAILEPVDKAQNVSYGVKLLLRSSLTSAISNTPGYEGYDRVDMASIAGEQDFQRTGNVSDSQIKQLGIATGAAYVLVTEAAEYDKTSIIITAKILDVETFGIKKSSVLVSGITADEMQKSCNALAATLLGTAPAAATPAAPAQQTSRRQAQAAAQPQAVRNGSEVKVATLDNGTSLYVAAADEPKRLGHDEAQQACSCRGEGWRLPTLTEMVLIHQYKSSIGGFSLLYRYWLNEDNLTFDMTVGTPMSTMSSVRSRVRCVRVGQ